MNQVFLSGIAFIIAFILWSSKKQSKVSPFLKSQKNYFPNSNPSTSFVQKNQLINEEEAKIPRNFKSKPFQNQPTLNSIETKKKLTKLISGNPSDRLLAIRIACQWNSHKALPFLRRGLKDSDSRVVIASATGISSFKGKTMHLNKKSQPSRPPRNVSLIR